MSRADEVSEVKGEASPRAPASFALGRVTGAALRKNVWLYFVSVSVSVSGQGQGESDEEPFTTVRSELEDPALNGQLEARLVYAFSGQCQ